MISSINGGISGSQRSVMTWQQSKQQSSNDNINVVKRIKQYGINSSMKAMCK